MIGVGTRSTRSRLSLSSPPLSHLSCSSPPLGGEDGRGGYRQPSIPPLLASPPDGGEEHDRRWYTLDEESTFPLLSSPLPSFMLLSPVRGRGRERGLQTAVDAPSPSLSP